MFATLAFWRNGDLTDNEAERQSKPPDVVGTAALAAFCTIQSHGRPDARHRQSWCTLVLAGDRSRELQQVIRAAPQVAPPGELDGFSPEQLDRNVEVRDVDGDVGGRMSPGVDGRT